jgi:superfamily I DNA and/or RNA helicase
MSNKTEATEEKDIVSKVLTGLISATQLELVAARDRSNQTKLELENGQITNQGETNFQARFSRKDSRTVDEGAQGQLTVFGMSRKAEILSIDEEFVTLQIEGTPIADLTRVTLSVDSSWLIEQMLQTLIEQIEGRKQFNAKCALSAMGETPNLEECDPVSLHNENLNFNQQEAIEAATSWTPGFIWGPPGTGKTHALGHLVGELVQRNERVLLASNTNVAVDTALLTTFRTLIDHPKIEDGLLVRLGPIQRADVYSEIGEFVDIARIVQRKSKPILLRKENAQVEQKQIEENATLLKERIESYSGHLPLLSKLQSLRSGNSENLKAIVSIDQKLAQLRSDIISIDEKVKQGQSKGALARLLDSEASLKSLNKKRNSIVAEIADSESRRSSLVKRGSALQKDLNQLQDKLPDFLRSDESSSNFDQLSKELSDLRKKWTELQEIVVACNEQMAKISANVLRNASAIFTTAYRTQSSSFDEAGAFHASIVDEASMLPLPLAWIVAGKASKRFVAAGDFRQIPPIAQSRDAKVEQWYRRSVFDCSDIPTQVESRGEVKNLGMLNMQYRMPQAISDLVSDFAYPEYGLVCMSEEIGGSKFSSSPIVLFDSSRTGAVVEKIESSRANSKHVQGIDAVVRKLIESGEVNYENLVSKISIIAPYRPQTKRIINALSNTIGEETAKRIVTTVHRMQGNEKEFIILDLVDAPPENIGLIFRGTHLRDQGPRLLNVAISRPRKQLIVIGSFEHISGRANSGHSYRGTQMSRFIELLEQAGTKVDLGQFLETGDV